MLVMVRPREFQCVGTCYKIGKVGKMGRVRFANSGYSKVQNLKDTVD